MEYRPGQYALFNGVNEQNLKIDKLAQLMSRKI